MLSSPPVAFGGISAFLSLVSARPVAPTQTLGCSSPSHIDPFVRLSYEQLHLHPVGARFNMIVNVCLVQLDPNGVALVAHGDLLHGS